MIVLTHVLTCSVTLLITAWLFMLSIEARKAISEKTIHTLEATILQKDSLLQECQAKNEAAYKEAMSWQHYRKGLEIKDFKITSGNSKQQ